MIGAIHAHSVKAKRIILVIIAVLVWQFSFPTSTGATVATVSSIEKVASESIDGETTNHLPEIDDKPEPIVKRELYITVTAYSSTPDQTQGDPFITASGARVRDGIIAANFLPIGTKVRFPEKFGNKIFVVEDRMHQRYWNHADIWMSTRDAAKEWGAQYTKIEIL